jgi:hypothetical protein
MLERHLDGELDAADRGELFGHLENCEACREILEAEERLIDGLSRLPRLMPPAGLRANILGALERERADAARLMAHEERYKPILQEPVLEWHTDPDEERPGTPPMVRRRSAWQRWSPAVATGFMAAASITAFLTTDLSSIPPLAAARQSLFDAGSRAVALVSPGTQITGGGRRAVAAADSLAPAETSTSRPHLEAPTIEQVNQTPEQVVAEIVQVVRGVGRVAGALAAAAEFHPPAPAEDARALAAIVIKPADRAQARSLDDDFGDALREARDLRAVAAFDPTDQFVSEGHRYRCYSVRVSADWVEDFVRTLEGYKAAKENAVLQVLNDQGHLPGEAANRIAFFTAPHDIVRHAVRHAPAVAAGAARAPAREIRIFVVE